MGKIIVAVWLMMLLCAVIGLSGISYKYHKCFDHPATLDCSGGL
jgi:hypothetical protein